MQRLWSSSTNTARTPAKPSANFRVRVVHWMVYVALATAPAANPPPAAIALMVVVVLTRIGPVYTVDEVVGVVPFVV